MSYPAAFAELTAATAWLLAADPAQAPAEPLPAAEASRLLAAREAVVGEVRTLAGLLTGPCAGCGVPGVAQLIDDPAQVLADALRALPTFPAFGAPSEQLGTGTDAWTVAARAAIALEAQHDAVFELSGAGPARGARCATSPSWRPPCRHWTPTWPAGCPPPGWGPAGSWRTR